VVEVVELKDTLVFMMVWICIRKELLDLYSERIAGFVFGKNYLYFSFLIQTQAPQASSDGPSRHSTVVERVMGLSG